MKVRLCETIVVERALTDCFRYLRDFSTIEQWDPGVYRAEKVTAGIAGEGSRYQLLLNVRGKHVPMTYDVVECVKDDYLLLVGEGDGLSAVDRITVRSLGAERTEIEYVADLTIDSLPQSALPLMRPFFTRLGKKAVGGLYTALTLPEAAPKASLCDRAADRALLPSAWNCTERGYLRMRRKGLSEFMDGKKVLITGPTAGLGLAAAAELSRLGAELILLGRDAERLQSAREQVIRFSGAPESSIHLYQADLCELAQTENAAQRIRREHPRLDVLINNAGALFARREHSSEGHERALAVNLLAPWVLTRALLPNLTGHGGRVINVASAGMYLQALHLEDMQYSEDPYNGSKAYARAKRALVAATEHLAEAFAHTDVSFNAMHPGWAATPGVAKSLPAFNEKLQHRLRDARMGADTMVWLASATEVAGISGRLWFDRKPHASVVLPGTAVGRRQREALVAWLERLGEGDEGVISSTL